MNLISRQFCRFLFVSVLMVYVGAVASVTQASQSSYGLYLDSRPIESLSLDELLETTKLLTEGMDFALPTLPDPDAALPALPEGSRYTWEDFQVVRISPEGEARLLPIPESIKSDREYFAQYARTDILDLLQSGEGALVLARYLEYVGYGLFDSVPERLRGFAGDSARHFLKVVADRVLLEDPSEIGQIGREQFEPGKIEEFMINADGSGHIYVRDVIQNQFNNADQLVAQTFRNWRVKIGPGGFDSIERGDDLSNPFSGDPRMSHLPAFLTDPADLRSIWARQLLYNLFAQGEVIEVVSVDERKESMVGGRLTTTQRVWLPNVDEVYKSTKDSCIDLLVDRHQPSHISGFPQQRGYCLGRCEHPKLINSR